MKVLQEDVNYKVPDWDKMWDDDIRVTVRNILLILEAIGMRFSGSGKHFEKIKHLLRGMGKA